MTSNNEPLVSTFGVITDPVAAVAFLFKDVDIAADGRLPNTPNLSINQLADELWVTKYVPLANSAQIKSHSRVKKNEFDMAVDVYYRNAIREARTRILANVFDDSKIGDYTEFNKFLDMMFPEDPPGPSKLAEIALLLFIQQVKLKLLGRHDDIKYHYFPVIVGTQGIGKSLSIKALTAPLDCLRFSIKLNQLKDINQIGPQFNKKFIAIADEMAGMKRTEIEDLKSIITSPTVDYRIYHSQNYVSAPNNSVFIGSSNRGIAEIMVDEQARRFIQIDLTSPINFDMLNKINYNELWQSIDVDENYLTKEYLELIGQHQIEDLSTEDEVALFLEEYGLLDPITETPGNETKIQQVTLYSAYIQFADERGFYRYSLTAFAKKIKRLGLATIRVGPRGKQVRHYAIPRAALKRLGNSDYHPNYSKLEVRNASDD